MAGYPRPVALFVLVILSVSLRNMVTDAGVTLFPCGDDDTAEVEQGKTDNTFICSGLGSGLKVDWTVVYGTIGNSAGTCLAVSDGGDCKQGTSEAFTPSRVSNTQSNMVVDPTTLANTELIAGGTLRCSDSSGSGDSCQMDYMVPVRGSCLVQTGTGSSRFKLSGSCTLDPGAQSSRDRFKCRWTNQEVPSWKVDVVLTEDNYQTGCTMSGQPLPNATGQYNYNVVLFPGRTSVSAGTIDITRPAAPTVTGCGGSDYVPENTAVSCTCSTDSIGQPSGRLQWVKVGDSSVNKVGNYGDKSLTVSQTLVRSDHQSSEFRCNVDWVETIPGTGVKFNVGYPPTQVLLELNQKMNLTVEEHQSVDFSCGNSNGRPDSTLSLIKKDNSSVLFSQMPTLSHEVVARCEDSGQYFCTADNGMGLAINGTSRSLYVQCSPRGDYDVGGVNFDDEPVSTTFDVTAYPVPDLVTFVYLGPALNDTGEPSEVNDDLIQLAGVCRNKPGVIHQSTCTVTVTSVTSHTAAGFYQVNVSNSQGRGQFRLQVLYKAPVTAGPDKRSEGDTDIGPIVGGVVAALVVIAVIILVVVLVVKRRKDPAKEKLETPTGRNAFNGGNAGSLGGLDNPAQEPPASASASPSTAGTVSELDSGAPSDGNVYAVVNKPKKPAAAAVETEAQAAGDSTVAVYAVVDKTKKKKKNEKAPPPEPEVKAKEAPAVKPRKRKGKKGSEGGVYGNVEDTKGKGKKGTNPPTLAMEETRGAGREVNPEGLVYTTMDFAGAAASTDPPPKAFNDNQGVLYSAVDFTKVTDPQN